jgi:hypothetical protein
MISPAETAGFLVCSRLLDVAEERVLSALESVLDELGSQPAALALRDPMIDSDPQLGADSTIPARLLTSN